MTDPTVPFALEQAAFQAWPALETRDLGGWRLRFADGHTKRGNSANLIRSDASLDEADCDTIEAFYRARGTRPIFRLVSFGQTDSIEARLVRRGYRFADLSLVMHKPLAAPESTDTLTGRTADPSATLRWHSSAEAWLPFYERLSGLPASNPTHLRLLRAIDAPCARATWETGGQPIACALGVVSDDHVGLFDVVTDAGHRRRGAGAAVCASLIEWGRGLGASAAFLQVVATNTGAIRLYERLGFRVIYHYWYRIGPDPSGSFR